MLVQEEEAERLHRALADGVAAHRVIAEGDPLPPVRPHRRSSRSSSGAGRALARRQPRARRRRGVHGRSHASFRIADSACSARSGSPSSRTRAAASATAASSSGSKVRVGRTGSRSLSDLRGALVRPSARSGEVREIEVAGPELVARRSPSSGAGDRSRSGCRRRGARPCRARTCGGGSRGTGRRRRRRGRRGSAPRRSPGSGGEEGGEEVDPALELGGLHARLHTLAPADLPVPAEPALSWELRKRRRIVPHRL